MKNLIPKFLAFALLLFGVALTLFLFKGSGNENKVVGSAKKIRSSNSPKAAPRTAANRDKFFFNALRDPALNRIPAGARAKELELFRSLKNMRLKSAKTSTYTWAEAGPNDVGGRTRALAVDVRNSDIVMAGGVSGGVWKSNDKGASWTLTNTPEESFSVTSISQDKRAGHQDTWYYAGGEYGSNSAGAHGAWYYGKGLYKSIDNGDSWNLVFGDKFKDEELNEYIWDFPTDLTGKIMVHPITGDVYLAVNEYGLRKVSFDGTTYTWHKIIGEWGAHSFCDFDFDANGNILCVLSQTGFKTANAKSKPGVYFIDNATETKTRIDTLSTSFPAHHERSLIRFAPSDPDIGYVYTHKGNDTVAFHKIDIAGNKLIDRTAYLPTSPKNDNGILGKQGNYNMTLAVKPDDPDFIIIGSTSLFRSKDGFTSIPEFHYGWIGGYEVSTRRSNISYLHHHADCHITVFDPDNNTAVWSGHDGGLSYTPDITFVTTDSDIMPWVDKNNGYNVTQYYTLADITSANEERYLGGTQDNGSPVFKWDGTTAGQSTDVSSGDGAYCYMGKKYAYVSSQNGKIMRVGYGDDNMPLSPYRKNGPWNWNWTSAHPDDAEGQLFINPFVVDRNNENTMYYAAGEQVWINKDLESIPPSKSKTMHGWYAPKALLSANTSVSTLAISKTPGHVLYYGCYSSNAASKLFRVKNSHYDEDLLVREDISVAEAPTGAYPYYIAINPANADEIIVIFSNYGVPSAFHSSDGGKTYTHIDGNLTATQLNPGPSFRSAAIQNWAGKKTYYISTSIGTYKTNNLNGTETNWEMIAPNKLGNVVCNEVKTSDLDGKVIIATHGRGLFVGRSNCPLFVANPPANEIVHLEDVSKTIDIKNVFGHSASEDIEVSLQGNSLESVVKANLSGYQLILDFSDTNSGVSYITLKASSGTDYIETTFSVSVKDHKDTSVEPFVEEKDEATAVYPNPSNGNFNISAENFDEGTCDVKVYNNNGRMVYTRKFSSIDELENYPFNLNAQSSGIYVVKIRINERVYTEKLRIR